MDERTRNGSRESRPVLFTVVAACAVALTFGMMAAVPAAAQTIVNGNFEGSPQTNPFTTVGSPSFLDAAQSWKVTLGNVNVGTGPAATRCTTTGGHCVDLNGASRGRIEQVIVIASGAKCSVTFMMSRHLQLGGSSATLKTFVNNIATSPASFTHNVSGLGATDGKWQSQGFTFQATGPATTLAFESAQEGAAGPQVDDVTITCTKPTPTGTLTVSKVVVNATGGAAPIPTTFNMTTNCAANAATLGTKTPVNVPPNASVSLANQVAAGSLCSVTETTPPHIPRLDACKGQGATWAVSYSPPVTIVSGSTSVLTVTNTLKCDPPTGGVLQVHKAVVNTLGVPSQPNWPMTATCTGVPQISLLVPSGGTVQAGGQLPAGTVCSVAEAKPPQVQGVKACPSGTASWVMTNPGPQTIQLAATTAVIITNTLTCDKPTAEGKLSVRKVVVNSTGDASAVPPIFNTTTHCSANAGSPATHSSVAVPGGQTVAQSTAVAAGFICSVTETLPPPIAKLDACKGRGATWTVSYSPPVTIVSGSMSVLTVTNRLSCDAPTGGSLQVHKKVVNTLGVPTPAAFNMVASCTGMAAAPLTVAAGQTATVSNAVPGGSVCTVTETLPPQVTGVRACPSGTASWVPSNPGPQTVQVAQTTGIIITNTLTCDTPSTKTGSLKVLKSVSNMTNGSVTLPTSYPMSVTCTPSGPTGQAISVPPGSVGTTIGSIAANSQCVVTEAPLPPITNVKACNGGSASWTTMGSPSNAVTVPSGGTATVTIRNTLRCDPPTVSECPNPAQTVIGCRITITVKRTKGPLIYSVIVSPPAPLPNVVAPSTPSSCVIGASAMINQTTCWFNYSTNPTAVTLTATSSAGALPAGFSWSGACSGSSATCVLSASPVQKLVNANFP